MATWNEKYAGQELVDCPVCLTRVAGKKRQIHMIKCWEKYSEHLPEMIRCPLYQDHILPRKYLNHHLEGNCDEAMNMLRKYFQKLDLASKVAPAPTDFLAEVPEELLNVHNKNLLYILKRDLNGKDISNDKSLYPDKVAAGELSRGSRGSAATIV